MKSLSSTARALELKLFALGVSWLLVGPAQLEAQVISVTVHVINGAGAPLWNAEVIDQDRGTRLLTSERGETTLRLELARPARLRVRQIGYRPIDTTLTADAVRGNAIIVTLQRVLYQLPESRVALRDDCQFGADTAGRALAADALEQLRLAAERYDHLQKGRQWQAEIMRTTKWFDSTGALTDMKEGLEVERLDQWGERYREGRVLDDRGLGFSVAFLHLQNFADPAFWKTHCFAVSEFTTLGEHKVLRLNFWPTRNVRTPDWAGWALIDSATSELRRVEMRLVGLREGDRPWKWEGFTTFTSPMPAFVVPDSVAAVWWRTKPTNPAAPPQVLQLLQLVRLIPAK